MRRIFWGFCINRFCIGPLHYVLSRSGFSFEFSEIFVIEKRLPHSPSRGVDKNACKYNFFVPLMQMPIRFTIVTHYKTFFWFKIAGNSMPSEKSILLKTLKLALCIGLIGEKRNSEGTYATIFTLQKPCTYAHCSVHASLTRMLSACISSLCVC